MRRATRSVGCNVLRKEGADKVTGAARYIDDLSFPGLLHARTIRSTIPAGEITAIRTAAASAAATDALARPDALFEAEAIVMLAK